MKSKDYLWTRSTTLDRAQIIADQGFDIEIKLQDGHIRAAGLDRALTYRILSRNMTLNTSNKTRVYSKSGESANASELS